jgi:hypothetical protein
MFFYELTIFTGHIGVSQPAWHQGVEGVMVQGTCINRRDAHHLDLASTISLSLPCRLSLPVAFDAIASSIVP